MGRLRPYQSASVVRVVPKSQPLSDAQIPPLCSACWFDTLLRPGNSRRSFPVNIAFLHTSVQSVWNNCRCPVDGERNEPCAALHLTARNRSPKEVNPQIPRAWILPCSPEAWPVKNSRLRAIRAWPPPYRPWYGPVICRACALHAFSGDNQKKAAQNKDRKSSVEEGKQPCAKKRENQHFANLPGRAKQQKLPYGDFYCSRYKSGDVKKGIGNKRQHQDCPVSVFLHPSINFLVIPVVFKQELTAYPGQITRELPKAAPNQPLSPPKRVEYRPIAEVKITPGKGNKKSR